MTDILLYHPHSGGFLGIRASEMAQWDISPLCIEDERHVTENLSAFIWRYSDRKGCSYHGCSSQGFMHKKTSALLGIDGTGEKPGPAVGIKTGSGCLDLLLTVRHIAGNIYHIIWPRAALCLSVASENGSPEWNTACSGRETLFEIRYLS